jgi:hypothetical protein
MYEKLNVSSLSRALLILLHRNRRNIEFFLFVKSYESATSDCVAVFIF